MAQGPRAGSDRAWLTTSLCPSPALSCAHHDCPPRTRLPQAPSHPQHSPCPCVPSPGKSPRVMTSHFAPHRSVRSGCQPGMVTGDAKGERGLQMLLLLPHMPWADDWGWLLPSSLSSFAEHAVYGTDGTVAAAKCPVHLWSSVSETQGKCGLMPRDGCLPGALPAGAVMADGMPPAPDTLLQLGHGHSRILATAPPPEPAPSPVIMDQQAQAPIVPGGFPEEGVNQKDDLRARESNVDQGVSLPKPSLGHACLSMRRPQGASPPRGKVCLEGASL